MTPKELLQTCEPLTHNERMRRMVEYGRVAAGDASTAAAIEALEHGNTYERSLSLQSCFGSRDSAHVLRALTDPSGHIHRQALSLAVLLCSDDEIQIALDALQPDLKKALLRQLHSRRRQPVIDTYIETLAAKRDPLLEDLLPFASREVVARHLDQLADQLPLIVWQRLARRHPELTIAQLSASVMESKEYDPLLTLRINTALRPLARFAPDLALGFVRTISATIPLARLELQALLKQRPNEIVDLVLQSQEQTPLRFTTVARRLDSERLVALFTSYPDTIDTESCFRKLTPAQRLAAYNPCGAGWRSVEGILPYDIVTALPAEPRVKEGRRHLALPVLATRLQERFSYAAFLPWDEARALLDTPLRSPDAELRSAALRTLIAATRYERAHLADALQLVRTRRNEQDPVRCVMLTALAALPHGIWRVEHLEDLAQIIQDALNATDLSWASARAAEQLVVQLFPFHAQWSATQMANIYSKRGQVNIYALGQYLSDADIQRIAPELMPILTAWQRQEKEWLLIRLAVALGKRLQAFDGLIDLLTTIIDSTLNSYCADTALSLLLKHRRARAATLIPALLKKDKSAITLRSVYSYLHRYRQDLLTPFLGRRPYGGRFDSGRTRFVLPLRDGFYRWTPAQQHIFAQTLLEIANATKDQHRTSYEVRSCIQGLAAMPDLDPALIVQFASDKRQDVRDSALRALGRLDAGKGIPTLLEALNDERARIAIYALRHALLAMPPAKALSMLRSAPLTMVTVAKEIVRLIGDLSTEEAYRELLAMEAGELHRDVRVALLRALWEYAKRPEVWEIFMRAARSPEAAIARGVVHIPGYGLPEQARKRLVLLMETLLQHPEPEVRMDTLRRCRQYPLPDSEHMLVSRLLSLINSPLPGEGDQAAEVFFTFYAGNDIQLVSGAIHDLLPNRRALKIASAAYISTLHFARRNFLPTTRAILEVLAQDRLTLSLRIELLIAGLPWEEVGNELASLAPELHADALVVAEQAIQSANIRPEARLLDLERLLSQSADERLRRLALAALVAHARRPGSKSWDDEMLARLRSYRNDPAPLVAEAAQFTIVPDEI